MEVYDWTGLGTTFFLTTPLLFNKVPRNMPDSQGTMFYHVAYQERHGV